MLPNGVAVHKRTLNCSVLRQHLSFFRTSPLLFDALIVPSFCLCTVWPSLSPPPHSNALPWSAFYTPCFIKPFYDTFLFQGTSCWSKYLENLPRIKKKAYMWAKIEGYKLFVEWWENADKFCYAENVHGRHLTSMAHMTTVLIIYNDCQECLNEGQVLHHVYWRMFRVPFTITLFCKQLLVLPW